MNGFSRGTRIPTQQRFGILYLRGSFVVRFYIFRGLRRAQALGRTNTEISFTRTPARAEPKVLRGAARRPPRRFARYASLTAGAGAWRRRCAKTLFKNEEKRRNSLCAGVYTKSSSCLRQPAPFCASGAKNPVELFGRFVYLETSREGSRPEPSQTALISGPQAHNGS